MKIGDIGGEDIIVDDVTHIISIGPDVLPAGPRGEKEIIAFLTKTDANITLLGDAYLKMLIGKYYPEVIKELRL